MHNVPGPRGLSVRDWHSAPTPSFVRPESVGGVPSAQDESEEADIDVDDDLAGHSTPGARVIINGVLRSNQRTTREGKSTTYDIILQANSIEYIDTEFNELDISLEEEEEIIEQVMWDDVEF